MSSYSSKLVLFLLWLNPYSGHAQELYSHQDQPLQKNTFFLELGGNGLIYSMNYDRILMGRPRSMFNGRIGVMYLPGLQLPSRQLIGMPLEISYCKGTNPHFVEFGIGGTAFYDSYTIDRYGHVVEGVLMAVARIGYRYQKRQGGMFFKAGFTPLRGSLYALRPRREGSYDEFTYPLIGLAIGYTLKAPTPSHSRRYGAP